MSTVRQRFDVPFDFPVHFTRDVFGANSTLLLDELLRGTTTAPKVAVVLDGGLVAACPALPGRVTATLDRGGARLRRPSPPRIVPGGEPCKSDPRHLQALQQAIAEDGLCRHSTLVAVGGGALLDLAGFVAATAHRGVRLIRVPSTVLAQDDAGLGVKNGVNAYGRKNYLGTFAPPWAVLVDHSLLATLPLREVRSGLAEAVKVAVLRDGAFFAALERDAAALTRGEAAALEPAIRRGAELHLEHIRGGGDPFELGSARPLDFGHWTAHRLEELTDGGLRHGEAVAIGVALDSLLARDAGLLPGPIAERICALLAALGLPLHHPALEALDVADALDRFREHLGGELTITWPTGLGRSTEVHAVEVAAVRRAVAELARRVVRAPERSDGGAPGPKARVTPVPAELRP